MGISTLDGQGQQRNYPDIICNSTCSTVLCPVQMFRSPRGTGGPCTLDLLVTNTTSKLLLSRIAMQNFNSVRYATCFFMLFFICITATKSLFNKWSWLFASSAGPQAVQTCKCLRLCCDTWLSLRPPVCANLCHAPRLTRARYKLQLLDVRSHPKISKALHR